jgi:hypothetical protein
MPLLARRKRAVGREMGSGAVELDIKQTSACAYLSAVVLVGLVANAERVMSAVDARRRVTDLVDAGESSSRLSCRVGACYTRL